MFTASALGSDVQNIFYEPLKNIDKLNSFFEETRNISKIKVDIPKVSYYWSRLIFLFHRVYHDPPKLYQSIRTKKN